MSIVNIRPWNSKPRTMLRFIKPGDIFVFKLNDEYFGFGRILTKVSLGHVAEIFDSILTSPTVTPELLSSVSRLGTPVVLDTYSLFDKRLEGDWQIVAHDSEFCMGDTDNVYFVYGHPNSWIRVDVFGNKESMADLEAALLSKYSPRGYGEVKEMFEKAI